MAQQAAAIDPNATPTPSYTPPAPVSAGSSDTYRSPGFRSANVDNTSLSGITTGTPAASTPQAVSSAPDAPALTPGMTAANGTALQANHGKGIGGSALSLAGGIAGNAVVPVVGGLIGSTLGSVIGNIFKKNNSPLQDIRQALQLGRPVSDASWAQAGYGPGGSAPGTPAAVAPTTPLGSVNSGTAAAPAIAPAAKSGGAACFVAGTKILMKDGSWKTVERLRLHDEVALGGKVTAHGVSLCSDLFFWRGETMSDSHVLFDGEDWMRARDCGHIVPLDKAVPVFPVVVEKHLIVTQQFVSADFAVVNHAENYTSDQRIDMLNGDRAGKVALQNYLDRSFRTRTEVNASSF